MVNSLTVPGLFQQMVEKNIRTFSPGVGQDTGQLGELTDIRDLGNRLVHVDIEFVGDLDTEGTEPAPIIRLGQAAIRFSSTRSFPGDQAPGNQDDMTIRIHNLCHGCRSSTAPRELPRGAEVASLA